MWRGKKTIGCHSEFLSLEMTFPASYHLRIQSFLMPTSTNPTAHKGKKQDSDKVSETDKKQWRGQRMVEVKTPRVGASYREQFLVVGWGRERASWECMKSEGRGRERVWRLLGAWNRESPCAGRGPRVVGVGGCGRTYTDMRMNIYQPLSFPQLSTQCCSTTEN